MILTGNKTDRDDKNHLGHEDQDKLRQEEWNNQSQRGGKDPLQEERWKKFLIYGIAALALVGMSILFTRLFS